MNKELLNENLNLIVFICNVIRLIFAYTSPKLYIIHYIKDLIQ